MPSAVPCPLVTMDLCLPLQKGPFPARACTDACVRTYFAGEDLTEEVYVPPSPTCQGMW